jgi:polar amino acid transport system permease protein
MNEPPAPAPAYATFFRGTPMLCQLYLVYYGTGEIRPSLTSAGPLDLMRQTRFVFARTFDFSIYLYAAIIYLYAAIIYLSITQAISRLWNWMERLMSRHLALVRAATMALPAGRKGQGSALDPLRAEP